MEESKLPSSNNQSLPKSKKQWTALHRTRTFWIIILILVVSIGLIRKQNAINEEKRLRTPPLSVVVSTSQKKNIPIYISALGNVTPTYTVTVKTQINGRLLQVSFKEGQMVKTGDLLAQVDPRPYEAELVQYEGQLIRDRALLANARIDLVRYQRLWKQDSVSQQTLATQESLVRQYEGAIRTDEGILQNTRLNLEYCRITAPVDGRIGLRLVDPGNYVQTSDTTGIAVINTLNPITVVFTIPEDNIPQIIPTVYAGKSLLVEAYDRQQNKRLASGQLLTIDNQVDPTTGTVKLKANFENKDNALFPNQFVNIKLLVTTLNNATVVPTAAIQHSTQGTFVYLLNKNQTVHAKPVTTGVTSGEVTVISTGLKPGRLVVVEGADKLRDGARVTVANPEKQSQQKQLAKKSKHGWRLFS